MTSIHGFESEDIAKESSICLSVLAVDNYVSTRNHFPLLEKVRNPYQGAQRIKVTGDPLAGRPVDRRAGRQHCSFYGLGRATIVEVESQLTDFLRRAFRSRRQLALALCCVHELSSLR